jgi:hypothetical protein
MSRLTLGEKIYFTLVASFALWVGFWGYFVPPEIDRAIPWMVPPLHARFLGSLYLSATVFLVWALFAERWLEVKITVTLVAVWTGWMLVVSCLHLKEFNYHKPQSWFWFGAYVFYPLIAFWLMWRHREDDEAPEIKNLPKWTRGVLALIGLLFTLLALSLFFMPGVMSTLWPWKVTPLLIQLYSAPFLAYGLGSLQMAWQEAWLEIRIGATAAFVFSSCVLIASILHRALFSSADRSGWIWFAGFGLLTFMFAWISGKAVISTFSERPS